MGHHRLTDQEKNFIWRSWRKGQTCEAIGGKIGKTNACVFLYLQRYGGIMPLHRKRRPDALTFRERKAIAKGLAAKLSIRDIARRLSRSPSTVSRELQRNSWRRGYDPARGEKATRRRACRPKACKMTEPSPSRSSSERALRRLVARADLRLVVPSVPRLRHDARLA